MGLFDGIREWQFRRNDDNFWRQATPAIREQLNPEAAARQKLLSDIRAANARNNERETVAVCRDLSRATTPAQRQAAHDRYVTQATRNHRALERQFGVGIQRTGDFSSLREVQQVCAKRGVPVRGR